MARVFGLLVGVALAVAGVSLPAHDVRAQTDERDQRGAYRDQLRRDLAARQALLVQQEARLAELSKRLADAHAALVPKPVEEKPDGEEGTPTPPRRPAPTAGGGGERSAQLERLTYEVNVSRSEINLTRQQIDMLQGLINRTR